MSKSITHSINCPWCENGIIEALSEKYNDCVTTYLKSCNKCGKTLNSVQRKNLCNNSDYIGRYRNFIKAIKQ